MALHALMTCDGITSQENSEEQASVIAELQCGKPCWRPLPSCPHPCQDSCHPGGCSGPCAEQVTVRCACKCAPPPSY